MLKQQIMHFSKGAHILNDVWGLHYDPDMAAVAAKYKVPVIIMHNSNDTNYDDIIEDMRLISSPPLIKL